MELLDDEQSSHPWICPPDKDICFTTRQDGFDTNKMLIHTMEEWGKLIF
jgi:Zn-dependent M32 family carboxypeptidase